MEPTSYYEVSFRIATAQMRVLAALEQGQFLRFARAVVQYLFVCWDPRAILVAWREVSERGFSATIDAGRQGALDALIGGWMPMPKAA